MSEHVDVAIIGAGISGLAAAAALAKHGRTVRMFEKSRQVGGRMATRRFRGMRFDTGAQFFTVRDPAFAELVARAESAGIVERWFHRGGSEVWRGSSAMTDLPKWLASGLPSELVAIETNSRVLSVQPAASNRPADRNRDRATRDRQIGDEAPFSIELAPEGQGAERSGHGAAAPAAGADPTTARRLTADRVVLTAPIPQALGLTAVPVRGTLRSALATAGIHESARTPIYAPCLTLLVHLRGAPDELLDDHGVAPRRPEIETPVEWVADNARKGLAPDSETDGDGRGVQTERVARVRSPDTFLTVHFAPEFSRSWYEEPDDAVTTALISALANYLRAVGDGTMDGSDPYETLSRVYRAGGVQLKKWRYARPNVEPAQDVAYVEAPAGLFLAGEAFRAGRVEGAFLSGRAAGRAAARERE